MDKAEMIAGLVTDKFSGFKEGDEAILETMSEARLEELRAAAETNKASAAAMTKLETDHRNTAARLKVAEEKLKESEKKPTKEQWIENAPAEIKTLLDRQATQEAEQKNELVTKLKGLGANTEDELKAMDLTALQTLAKYAKVDAPAVDFSGRGAPRVPSNNNDEFKAPNPYEEPLKALRAATAAAKAS